MTKLGAALLLVVGTAVVWLLTAPLLVASAVGGPLRQGWPLPQALGSVCALALVLAWVRLLVGTVLCLTDEISRCRAATTTRGAGARGSFLRPAMARRIAGALLGGGLTCLVLPPAAPAAHASGHADLPLPVRPLGAEEIAEAHLLSTAAPRDTVVVRPGDTLWSIAASRLGPGMPTDAAVDAAWRRLYAHNRSTVGPQPDLIHPGARLRMP